MNYRIGWIGTGVMGRSMCSRLLQAGCRCMVYNRTKSRAQSLLDSGAIWSDSPADVARCSDIVFLMVGYPSDVRALATGSGGILDNFDSAGAKILVDMTTSSPSLARTLAELGQQKGVAVLDAPVSGGDIGAQKGTLSIMVGGDEQTAKIVWPLFEKMGTTIVYQGAPGSGQHTKMVNQILIAGNMVGLCEALLYASATGLNAKTVLESVSTGAAGSWSLSNLAPRILRGDFAPGFYVEHFIKDLRIALEEADRMNLALPGLALAKQLYVSTKANGYGRNGTQALILTLKQMSGIE